MATERAVLRGDWMWCAGCQSRIALGVRAVRTGSRIKCYRCKAWVAIPVDAARE